MKKTPYQLTNNIFNSLFSILGLIALFVPESFINIRYKFNIIMIILSFIVFYIFIFLVITIIFNLLKDKKWTKRLIIYAGIVIIGFFIYYKYCLWNTSVSILSYERIQKISFKKAETSMDGLVFEFGDNIKEMAGNRYQITELIKTDNYFIEIEFADGNTIDINRSLTGFIQTINVKHLRR